MTALPPGAGLFETMHATRGQGIRLLDRHLDRLLASARHFGLACDEAVLRALLARRCAELPAGVAHRMRLSLAADGGIGCTAAPLAPLATSPVGLLVAAEHGHAPTDSADEALRHKTTARDAYDRAWQAAERLGAFDMLFVNERGEVTEGGRSNLFVRLGGRWLTPPPAAGLLPGVMRAALLADPAWAAAERTLSLDEVAAADELVLCNALRGAMPARLLRSG